VSGISVAFPSRPCRLNDENSRAKFQNVRGDSSVVHAGSNRGLGTNSFCSSGGGSMTTAEHTFQECSIDHSDISPL
jgi:hypothetical protein